MNIDYIGYMKELFDYFDKFLKLSAETQNILAGVCSTVFLKKNELLQPIGHTCKTIYFVQSGIARIFYYKDGVDITESFAFAGNIIVRVESLFTGKPSKKAIQVLEDSEIIAINATKLFKLYDEYPSIERLFRLIFENGYVETVNRIESIQFHTAEERYLSLLKQTNIVQKIPLKHIASYLGITQVSLSRIRASIK
ncbi:putative transcriptional regulator, Crp/Fnr family [Emticicia oligotrophica DSM 17448]|uniref:Transcriptional regulator, Crp/Fnr family n=1 Tax=Emticicia oligotrophica (strain DSM 17448 / CIP 109782 / MTCC 6937 / GPTSA100-15) TaxID=929562 RepID=A0ABN4APK5_EMTOG|nr:Crp/Fnr family transcriptional regulator [Emticicia oligotrophica]AFK04277.1 putative transcriptional regulator, Crp/Fnr family [Emticicia oligotrophica DSM 17448]